MKQCATLTDRPPARRRAFRLLALALTLLALALALPAGAAASPAGLPLGVADCFMWYLHSEGATPCVALLELTAPRSRAQERGVHAGGGQAPGKGAAPILRARPLSSYSPSAMRASARLPPLPGQASRGRQASTCGARGGRRLLRRPASAARQIEQAAALLSGVAGRAALLREGGPPIAFRQGPCPFIRLPEHRRALLQSRVVPP